MKGLYHISKVFLLKSKVLSISCIISVFIAVVMIISMVNLSANAEMSYINKLRLAYGNCDAVITYENYELIPSATVEGIKNLSELDGFSAGYFDSYFRIDGNSVYLIGSDNSDLVKGRYHYKSNLKPNEIAINSVLAGCLRCGLGDAITIDGIEFHVTEIFEDNTGSAASITMAIVNLEVLQQLQVESLGYNFVLISVRDNNLLNTALNEIHSIDRLISINAVETDEVYKGTVESFAIFIKALMVCVIIVTGLFVTSIMKRFIYKYRHDLAVIRAIGGSREQVTTVFRYIIISINLLGCTTGLIGSLLLNKLMLGWLNDKMQFFDGEVRFYFFKSFMIASISFLVLTCVLLISIQNSFKVLPLKAFMQNEIQQIGKQRKTKKNVPILSINRLLGNEAYITLKFIFVRLRENLIITFTIMMIVVISFIGSGLSNMIQKNNDKYLEEQFLADTVVTSSSPISYEDFTQYYDILQNTKGINTSMVLSPGLEVTYNEEPWSYMIADIDAMEQQGIFELSGAEKNRIILSKETADKYDISVGSFINVTTPPEYIYDAYGRRVGRSEEPYKVRMYVAATLSKETMHNSKAYIDLQCSDFIQEMCFLDHIYVNGDLNSVEQLLSQIKTIFPGIKWENYKEVVEIGNKAIRDRFLMFEMIVGILALIAGVGWFNAIRYTILSRTKEYNILRMNGMTIRRLRKMLFIQVAGYLSIGVVSGVLVGMALLGLLTYLEMGTLILVLDLRSLSFLGLYMLFLCSLLIPVIIKVSKEKLIIVS